jgi:hypothetical protein
MVVRPPLDPALRQHAGDSLFARWVQFLNGQPRCSAHLFDARYRIADDRGAQGRWADMSEPLAKIIEQFQLHMSSQFYSEWRTKNTA